MAHPTEQVTLGEVRESLSKLARHDVGEVQAFLVITYDMDGGMMVFGYPGCQPCRVGYLADALARIGRDMTHEEALHL